MRSENMKAHHEISSAHSRSATDATKKKKRGAIASVALKSKR